MRNHPALFNTVSILVALLLSQSALGFQSPITDEGKVSDPDVRNRSLGSCKKWKKKHFIERAESDLLIYNTEPNKVSPGDITVWHNDLYDSDDEDKKGTSQGFCIFLPELVYECSITLNFGDTDQIMVQGALLENPWKLAISGGTGCFDGTEGEVKVTASYDGKSDRTQYRITAD